MAITLEELYKRVKAHVGTLRGEGVKPYRSDEFERQLPQALRNIALKAWMTPTLRPLITLHDGLDVEFTAGVAPIVESTRGDPLSTELHDPPLCV